MSSTKRESKNNDLDIVPNDMAILMRDEKEIKYLFERLNKESDVKVIDTGKSKILNRTCYLKELSLNGFIAKFSVTNIDVICLSFSVNDKDFNLFNSELLNIENMFIDWAKNVLKV